MHTLFKYVLSLPAVMPISAIAQNDCQTYVGKNVTAITIDAAFAKLSKVPNQKGEFETTAAFNARVEAAAGAGPGPMTVALELDRSHLKYDADAGMLNISAYALDNRNVGYEDVFGSGTPFEGKVDYSPFENIDLVVSETETPAGSYRATNGYGATFLVSKVVRTTKAIFDRRAGPNEDQFAGQEPGGLISSLPMSPAEAQRFKATARAVAIIAPKAPYFASGTRVWRATAANRAEVTQPTSVIIADIQCVLLTNAASQTVAAFAFGQP